MADRKTAKPKRNVTDMLTSLIAAVGGVENAMRERQYQENEERRLLRKLRRKQADAERMQIAAMAMQGILSSPQTSFKHDALIVAAAVDLTDKLIAELSKPRAAPQPRAQDKEPDHG